MREREAALLIFEDAPAAAEACGSRLLELIDAARHERGIAYVAVSGGSSPRPMFEAMAKHAFDWSGVELFLVDERCVPPDHELSNYRMIRESFLARSGFPESQMNRVKGELPPGEAAKFYIEEIRRIFALTGNELPVFDVIHRGMGTDGHTASLFPGEPLIRNRSDIAAAVWVEKMKQHRVTLLPGVLASARSTLCLAPGEDKADSLTAVLRGPADEMNFPAQIGLSGTLWYVDKAATAALDQRSTRPCG